MITKSNFKDLLKTLGFTEEGNIFQKSIGEADLEVDFSKQNIIYPEDKGLKVTGRNTCNFSQGNFLLHAQLTNIYLGMDLFGRKVTLIGEFGRKQH